MQISFVKCSLQAVFSGENCHHCQGQYHWSACTFLWKDLPMHVSAWPAIWSLHCTPNGWNVSHHSRCMAPTSPKAATQVNFLEISFSSLCTLQHPLVSVSLSSILWLCFVSLGDDDFSCLIHLHLFSSCNVFTVFAVLGFRLSPAICTSPGEQSRNLGAGVIDCVVNFFFFFFKYAVNSDDYTCYPCCCMRKLASPFVHI